MSLILADDDDDRPVDLIVLKQLLPTHAIGQWAAPKTAAHSLTQSTETA